LKLEDLEVFPDERVGVLKELQSLSKRIGFSASPIYEVRMARDLDIFIGF